MKQSGFTVLEILIVLGILGTLVGVTALPFNKFRKEQALQNTTNLALTVLNEARAKTLSGTNNTTFGVKIESTSMTLFEGVSYVSGKSSNQVFTYESPVTLGTLTLSGGGTTVLFDRLRGTTDDHGTLNLQLPDGSARTISISANGAIARQ